MQDGDTLRKQDALVRALCKTGNTRRGQGCYSQAERLYQRALSLAENTFGPEAREVATIMSTLAAINEAQGKNMEAEPLYRRARALTEELHAQRRMADGRPTGEQSSARGGLTGERSRGESDSSK